MEMVSLDTKAQRRLRILTRVVGGGLSISEAAAAMGLSPRHTRRLVSRFELEGARALVHGNRGRPPTNRISEASRQQILDLVEDEYEGFNDVHLQEALLRDYDIRIGRETLRGLLRSGGHKPKRRRRARRHRRRRERRPRRGMMVQWDGSHHPWLGPGRETWVLMAAVDDADGSIVGARFMPSESGAAYLLLLDQILAKHGIPESIYQDRHGALCRNDGHWSLDEEIAGQQSPTQLGAVLEELGIHPIFARSAQGKGRIERFFGVAQDRLSAELRRSGVASIDEANAFLEDYWIEAYNRRFAEAPAEAESVYCPITALQRHLIASFRYRRVVTNDNRVRLGDLEIQIPPGPRGRSYAKSRVEVRQHTDGSWTVMLQDQRIARHEPTALQMPERVRLQRNSARHVRRVAETVQVYFTPTRQELREEVSRSS